MLVYKTKWNKQNNNNNNNAEEQAITWYRMWPQDYGWKVDLINWLNNFECMWMRAYKERGEEKKKNVLSRSESLWTFPTECPALFMYISLCAV